MNDQCLLVKTLAAKGPSPVPLHPCCTAAVVALQDRDRPTAVWLCPLEDEEQRPQVGAP
jgi:alpha-D-ribose 1-methylphosphonate 5-triphosphate synthase subunit PhnH